MTSELRTEESKVRQAALESNLAAQPSKKNSEAIYDLDNGSNWNFGGRQWQAYVDKWEDLLSAVHGSCNGKGDICFRIDGEKNRFVEVNG